tara:strand:- start:670 stop:1299 length:630 start_codon:yes stop_codon:yes gene_type:complete
MEEIVIIIRLYFKILLIKVNIMSKETSINNIKESLSKEEDDIVNSILSEINDNEIDINKSQGSNNISIEENNLKMNEQYNNQSMNNQSMNNQPMNNQPMNNQPMNNQMMNNQMMNNQMMNNNKDKINTDSDDSNGFFKNILNQDFKEPLIIAAIAFLLFLPQTNSLLLSTGFSAFIDPEGSISMMGTAFKCLSIGILYFTFKTLINHNK